MERKSRRYRAYNKNEKIRYKRETEKLELTEKKIFWFKINIIICIIIAVLIMSCVKTETSSKAIEHINYRINENISIEKLNGYFESCKLYFNDAKKNIETFADENNDVKIDDEILNEINSKEDLYYKNQKK